MEREKIIQFLENPKNYPQPVKKVRHLETYISDVFLTGKYAYKIKKPVNYGYLDFTTLAKRKFFCRRELELNQRLSPQMYLGVLPIVKKENKAIRRLVHRSPKGEGENPDEGGLQFGNHGKIVDYALKMKEIPEKYIMYRLVKKHKINKETIREIAKILAKFYQKAETSNKINQFGSLKIISKNWQENFSQTKSFIGKTISRQDFYFLKNSVAKFINKNRSLFIKRIKNKKIRDGHGDLHTGNIFVTPNKIYIFDCIEFTERFRYQDVANEVAFLAMDLDYLKRKDLSNYFVEKYIDLTGDYDLKKLLLFYKCYRAYIKGKVCGFHFANQQLRKAKRKMYKKIAQESFKFSVKYAKAWQKSILILGAGLPGVGRSTRLKILAKKIDAQILDSDIIRKQIKKTEYSQKSKLVVYQKMMQLAEKYLRQGKNVILDATFYKKIYRQLAIDLIQKLEISYYLIEFFASDRIAKQRFLSRAKEKNPTSQADWTVYLKIKKEFEPIKENHFKINTALKPEQNVAQIIKYLNL